MKIKSLSFGVGLCFFAPIAFWIGSFTKISLVLSAILLILGLYVVSSSLLEKNGQTTQQKAGQLAKTSLNGLLLFIAVVFILFILIFIYAWSFV